jgi:hypothetical protein
MHGAAWSFGRASTPLGTFAAPAWSSHAALAGAFLARGAGRGCPRARGSSSAGADAAARGAHAAAGGRQRQRMGRRVSNSSVPEMRAIAGGSVTRAERDS